MKTFNMALVTIALLLLFLVVEVSSAVSWLETVNTTLINIAGSVQSNLDGSQH